MKNNYYHSLDLFRGFCGYGVAICHLNAFAFGNSDASDHKGIKVTLDI